jgi:hypothetical protein
VILFIPSLLSAQSKSEDKKKGLAQDTLIQKKHTPGKAALYSALLPGGGQFYNKRYWKIPVIYTGLFIIGGFVGENNKQYNDYKNEAINRYNYDVVKNYTNLTDQQVLDNMQYYERQRNLNILIFVGIYLLQIVDATVDAQFYTFDVNENISLNIEPYFSQPEWNSTAPINTGLSFSLKF